MTKPNIKLMTPSFSVIWHELYSLAELELKIQVLIYTQVLLLHMWYFAY